MAIKPPQSPFRVDHIKTFALRSEAPPSIVEKIVEVPVVVVDNKKVHELTEINRSLESQLTTMRLDLNKTKELKSAEILNLHAFRPKEVIVEKPVIVETIKKVMVSKTPNWVPWIIAATSVASYLLGKVIN